MLRKKGLRSSLLGLVLVVFLVAYVVACGPQNQNSTPKVAGGGFATSADIEQTSDTQIVLTIKPSPAQERQNNLYWNGFINNVMLRPESYTLTRVDITPEVVYTIVNVKLKGERTKYTIQSRQMLVKGNYKLRVNYGNYGDPKDYAFSVLGKTFTPGAEGNYIPFTKVVKKYPNGVIVTIDDAEIGSPSTVVMRVSYPGKISQAPTNPAYQAIESAFTGSAFSNSESLYVEKNSSGNYTEQTGTKLFSISPDIKGAKVLAGTHGGIRTVVLAGFTSTSSDIPDIEPTRTHFEEKILVDATDATYVSYSSVVYLQDLPVKDQVYKVSFKAADGTVYSSGSFMPRFAFTSGILQAYLNPASSSPCFISPTFNQVKCFGDNEYGQIGLSSDLTSLPVYNTDFLPFANSADKIFAIASNGYAGCGVFNLSNDRSTSNVRCWGTNWLGVLGTGNKSVGPLKGMTLLPGFNANQFSRTTRNVGNVQTEAGDLVSGQSILANKRYFCTVKFPNTVYCWGNTIIPNSLTNSATRTSDTYTPFAITKTLYDSSDRPLQLLDYQIGDNPDDCFTYTTDQGATTRLACLSMNAFNNSIYYGTASGRKNHNHYVSVNGSETLFEARENPDYTGTSSGTNLPDHFVNVDFYGAGDQAQQNFVRSASATPVKVSVGEKGACLVAKNGSATNLSDATMVPNVFCWGSNDNGQFGNRDIFSSTNSQTQAQIASSLRLGTDPHNLYPAIQKPVLDVYASAGFVCVIVQGFQLHCVGSPRDGAFTNPASNARVFLQQYCYPSDLDKNVGGACITDYRASMFDFGTGVEVIRIAKGDSILCADLRYKVEGEYSYAVKCWGLFSLTQHRLYSKPSYTTSTYPKLVHPMYYPVIRW